MIAGEEVIIRGNAVFGIEVRGFDHIPEPERNMALKQIAYLWVGNSVNLFGFALGALAVSQGLSLWLALLSHGDTARNSDDVQRDVGTSSLKHR